MWTHKELAWISELAEISDDEIKKIIRDAEKEAHEKEMIAFTHKLFLSLRHLQTDVLNRKEEITLLIHEMEKGA